MPVAWKPPYTQAIALSYLSEGVSRLLFYQRFNKELALKWIDKAKENLEDSKASYGRNSFSNSINLLQQCYECASKAYLIFYSDFNPDKEKTHQPIHHHLKEKFLKMDLKKTGEIVASITRKNIDLKKYQDDYDRVYKLINPVMVFKLSLNDFILIEKFHDSLEEELTKPEQIMAIQSELRRRPIKGSIKHETSKRMHTRIRCSVVISQTEEKSIRRILNSLNLMRRFLTVSYVVCYHYLSTKYPTSEKGKLGYDDYVYGLGIVDYYWSLWYLANDFITLLSSDIGASRSDVYDSAASPSSLNRQ